MMRILNIMLAEVRGGVETMSLRYHQAMQAAGHDVISIGHRQGVLGQNLPPAEFRAAHALVNHDPFVALALHGIARDFRPDLILTHGNRATGIALLPLLGTAGKTVQVVHNFRHKSQAERLRAAICVSTAVHDSLKAAHPGLALYDVPNFGPLDVRDVKSAPTDVPIIGTLGRLHAQKGIDVMIRALAALRDRGTAVRLVVAGDGPQKAELQALAADLKVDVDFRGWVSPAADYLSGLDLFVLPSRIEPFGLVVTEAMAAGVPVVSTAIDGPKEILRDAEGGLLGHLCPPEDPQGLATAVQAALSHWPATLDTARAAQAHALSRYSLAAGQARLDDTLKQIAQNHPGRA